MHSNGWKILEKHAQVVHALLLRITLRSDVADDLLHDLFVKLAGRIEQIDNPAGYMHRTAINMAMDWRRSRNKEPRTFDVSPEKADPTQGPGTVLEQADEIERILDAALNLSELEYQVFVLRFVQQNSYEQIGQLLQRTAHQIRGLCDAVVKHLRKELNERLVTDERAG